MISLSTGDVFSFIFTVLGLLGIGLYGLLATRHLIKIIIVLQVLVKAAVLALIAAGAVSGQLQLAQSLAVTVIVVDTVVAIVGLALAIKIQERCQTLDIQNLSSLKG